MFNIFYCGQGPWHSTPWLEKTGSDPLGINKMKIKANILPIYVEGLCCAAANVLKQEMLSLGGEVSVHKQTVTCQQEFTDALILGTPKQCKLLIPKLMPQYWKLKDLSAGLKIILANLEKLERKEAQIVSGKELATRTLIPSGDMAADLRDLPLVPRTMDSPVLELTVAEWLQELTAITEYTKALQSKGYFVSIPVKNTQEQLIGQYLQVDFLRTE